MRKTIIIVLLTLLAGLGVAGCKGSSPGSTPTTFGPAKGAIASVTADPAVQADLNLAKADIKRCVTGTPLQQIHTVHVVLLSSAHGRNGGEVTAARHRVFGCLGVPPDRQTQFKNDSLTAAERQHPRVWTKAGIKEYALVTWPGILTRYQHAAGATATPSAPASPSKTGATS